jgi:hypothetical protein
MHPPKRVAFSPPPQACGLREQIEAPRNSRRFAAIPRGAGVISAAIVLAVPAPDITPSAAATSDIGRPNFGLGEACNMKQAFRELPECMTSPDPEYAVWGDFLREGALLLLVIPICDTVDAECKARNQPREISGRRNLRPASTSAAGNNM